MSAETPGSPDLRDDMTSLFRADAHAAQVLHDQIAAIALRENVGEDAANRIASGVMKLCFDAETHAP